MIVESQEAMYAAFTVGGGIVGAIVGYATSKLFGSKVTAAEIAKERYLSEQETRRSELDLETARESNKLELEKLRYGHANEEHQRTLDTTVQDREYEDRKTQESREYERSQTQERRSYETARAQENIDHELALADKLVELKPVIENYLEELAGITKDPASETYLCLRQDYREEIHEEYIEDCDKFDIDTEDAKDAIENLVDLKLPLEPHDTPRIPNELKSLLSLFNK